VLVLSRKKSEKLVIPGVDDEDAGIRIVVLEIGHGFVKLGIEASPNVAIHRMEVWDRINSGHAVAKAS
jgi:carbon storage regulator CsrA